MAPYVSMVGIDVSSCINPVSAVFFRRAEGRPGHGTAGRSREIAERAGCKDDISTVYIKASCLCFLLG